MIPRANRFHGHGSLKYVSKKAVPIRSKWFTIKAVPNRFRQDSRISVVVSRKIHKRAVIRNKIRRRIYEIIRLELPKLTDTYDIVIIVTSVDTLIADHREVRELIHEQLNRAGIYK